MTKNCYARLRLWEGGGWGLGFRGLGCRVIGGLGFKGLGFRNTEAPDEWPRTFSCQSERGPCMR